MNGTPESDAFSLSFCYQSVSAAYIGGVNAFPFRDII